MAGNLEPGVQVSFWIGRKRFRGTFSRMDGPMYVVKSESLHEESRVDAADIIWGTQQTPGEKPDYSGLIDDIGNQSDEYKAERDALQKRVKKLEGVLRYIRSNLMASRDEIRVALEDEQDD